MSISEQINSQIRILRSLSFECHCQWKEELEFALSDAANTIESLMQKLTDMERSAEDCGGGWILCKDKLPEDEGMYLITAKVLNKMEVQYVFFQKNMDLFICNGIAMAWKPLPEPYHEP